MGTIFGRRRKDGTMGYTAQIIKKKGGEVIWSESETFDRRQAAAAWMARREEELTRPGALDFKDDPKLIEVIDRYLEENKKTLGKTKAQVLKTIKTYDIADKRCSRIGSDDIVALARALPVKPQTVQSYLSHVSPIFKIARPAWGYPLDRRAMEDALVVCKQLGLVRKSLERTRRPTLDEIDRLMTHFAGIKKRRPGSANMPRVVAFAIYSTRRQEEITRILWDDYEPATEAHPARVLVRDMKHPGDKEGNDTWCELVPEAAAIIESMPRAAPEIFPYHATSISGAFQRACTQLLINTKETPDEKRLHFHDLRHDGISRLFEMGRNIPQAASVSGHRSWSSLKRYTHVRQTGDKYENWKWRNP